jgi:hypothetical protein
VDVVHRDETVFVSEAPGGQVLVTATTPGRLILKTPR